jgi:hypothetical protein
MAEYSHRLGLKAFADRFLPMPGSHRGDAPSVFGESLIMMMQGGGRHLEDLRMLTQERGLMALMGITWLFEGLSG